MHKSRVAVLLAALVLLATACKKTDEADPTQPSAPSTPFTPLTYPKGVEQNVATHKSIGATGGTITSDDGKMTVNVPAGAVASSTDFTIQPITNTVPLGKGSGYRMLPANASLAKPVTISLKYDEADMDGCDEDAFYLVIQDAAGIWKVLNRTAIDKGTRTLSAQTTHLNDLGFTGFYYLIPQRASLSAGESTTLTVKKVTAADNTTDEESALGVSGPFSDAGDFEGWEKSGNGTMDAGQKTSASFTAPASVDNSSGTEIRLNLQNVKRSRSARGPKVALRTKINLQTENFMSGTYDGQPFNCVGVSAATGAGMLYVQGITASGKQILIIVHGNDLGDYPYGDPDISGRSEIRCNLIEDVYETVYTPPCVFPSVTRYASGGASIKTFNNTTIAGEFNATLYDEVDCNLKTKVITGAFRARRS